MDAENPFDRKLDIQAGAIPDDVHGGLVHLVDGLDLCWAGAQAVFKQDARPEHALALLQLLEGRLLSNKPAPRSRRDRS